MNNDIVKTPWDAACFGIDTYEIKRLSVDVLDRALKMPGHFSIKVDPLSSKKLLHDYGFYYCDTLLEPYCTAKRFIPFLDGEISIVRNLHLDDLLKISHGAFEHGRFHRDFNIARWAADLRYDNWLRELFSQNNILGLMSSGVLAGFIGISGNRILLHALSAEFKGKGLSKFFWSAACKTMFEMGHNELMSSISASNTVVLNLYASLGFKFRAPLDVYHRLVVI